MQRTRSTGPAQVSGRRLEVTTTSSGTFVRYLPAATHVGDKQEALTVATYELAGAWNVAQQPARRKRCPPPAA